MLTKYFDCPSVNNYMVRDWCDMSYNWLAGNITEEYGECLERYQPRSPMLQFNFIGLILYHHLVEPRKRAT